MALTFKIAAVGVPCGFSGIAMERIHALLLDLFIAMMEVIEDKRLVFRRLLPINCICLNKLLFLVMAFALCKSFYRLIGLFSVVGRQRREQT